MGMIVDHDQRSFAIGSIVMFIVMVIAKVSALNKGSGSLEMGWMAKRSRS